MLRFVYHNTRNLQMKNSMPMMNLPPLTTAAKPVSTFTNAAPPFHTTSNGAPPIAHPKSARANTSSTAVPALPSHAQPGTKPTASQPQLHGIKEKARHCLLKAVGYPRRIAVRCRSSRVTRYMSQFSAKSWISIISIIAGLLIGIVGIVVTVAYSSSANKSSQKSNEIAEKALAIAVWSASNDFHETCASDLDSGRPVSAACVKALARPVEPPPDWKTWNCVDMGHDFPVLAVRPTLNAVLVMGSKRLRWPAMTGSRHVDGFLIVMAFIWALLTVPIDVWVSCRPLFWLIIMSWIVAKLRRDEESLTARICTGTVNIAGFSDSVLAVADLSSDTVVLLKVYIAVSSISLCLLWHYGVRPSSKTILLYPDVAWQAYRRAENCFGELMQAGFVSMVVTFLWVLL